MSSSASRWPSRLALMSETASVTAPPVRAARSVSVKAAGSRTFSSTGPSAVSTSRSPPPASSSSWRQRPQGSSGSPSPATTATARSARRRPGPAVRRPGAGGVERRDQAAFGAQGQAVGGVLHIAAGDDPPVGGQASRADPEPGIGSVGMFRCGRGGQAKPWPVDDHVTTLEHLTGLSPDPRKTHPEPGLVRRHQRPGAETPGLCLSQARTPIMFGFRFGNEQARSPRVPFPAGDDQA